MLYKNLGLHWVNLYLNYDGILIKAFFHWIIHVQLECLFLDKVA